MVDEGDGKYSVDTDELARFSRGLEQTQSDVGQLKVAVATLTSSVTTITDAIKNLAENTDRQISNLTTAIDADKRERRTTGLSLVSPALYVIIAAIGLAGTIVSFEISGMTRPLDDKVSALMASRDNMQRNLESVTAASMASTASDVDSRRDRDQLNERMRQVEGKVVDATARIDGIRSHICTSLGEVEQQFKAVSNVLNLTHIQDQRNLALLWHKAYGEDYPSSMYYPTAIFRDDATRGNC